MSPTLPTETLSHTFTGLEAVPGVVLLVIYHHTIPVTSATLSDIISKHAVLTELIKTTDLIPTKIYQYILCDALEVARLVSLYPPVLGAA